MIGFHNFGLQMRVFYFAHMSFCGSTTMSERQTVSEALDIFLDYGPAEDKNTEREEVAQRRSLRKKLTKLRRILRLTDGEGAHAITITYCSSGP